MVALLLMMDTGMMAPVRGWLARAEHLVGDEPAGMGVREDTDRVTKNFSRFLPHGIV